MYKISFKPQYKTVLQKESQLPAIVTYSNNITNANLFSIEKVTVNPVLEIKKEIEYNLKKICIKRKYNFQIMLSDNPFKSSESGKSLETN